MMRRLSLISAFAAALLPGCNGPGTTTTTDMATAATVDLATAAGDAGGTDCTKAVTHIDKAVCAANNFLAVLPAGQKSSVNLAFTDNASRTKWSNLPGVARAGLKMSALDQASQTAALALMSTLLSASGAADLTGTRAADDYLGSMGGGMAGQYGAGNYYVAVFGTPSSTGNWEVAFGGHHMAFNITYLAGTGYPVPNHLGVEPKGSFTINGNTYEPMQDEGAAVLAAFKALGAGELDTAYLSGQTFADVVVGPVEYGTGSTTASKAKFPTGGNRKGVLVSNLTAQQQALVTAAIQAWVADYDPAVATPLLTAYTGAYADTYLAWGGTKASGVDPDVNGTYMRIDGPRVWIELSCQGGVVIQGKTHYHSIFRDKQSDYGGTI